MAAPSARQRGLLEGVPEKDIPALLALQREKDIVEARNDFNTFAELVCRDDETDEPIRQAAIHRAWTKAALKYDRLLIWAHRYAGKTVQLSVLRTVWELGRDPSLRFIILSATQDLAIAIVAAIANYIKSDETVREIFPDLMPDEKGGSWSNTKLDVIGRRDKRNPSVRACGVGTALRGSRGDRLIVDDILTAENTATPEQRRKVTSWLRSEAFGCLSRRARVLIVGNAMHPDDALHELAKLQGWKWLRFPILNPAGESTWPEMWPHERIKKARIDMGLEFAKNMMCRARSDEDARFKQEWIDAALKRGADLTFVDSLEEVPAGCSTWSGVDLGVSKKKKSDKSAVFTFLEDENGNRTLLRIRAGKWTGPEILDKLKEEQAAFHSIIAVENNAAQDFILQFAKSETNLPVLPHTTSGRKRDPIFGVEGLAIELSNGKWTFPSKGGCIDPQLSEFIVELLYYVPKAHTGDRLMACYFARELARRLLGQKSGPAEVSVTIVGPDEAQVASDEANDNLLERLFNPPERSEDLVEAVVEKAIAQIRARISNAA